MQASMKRRRDSTSNHVPRSTRADAAAVEPQPVGWLPVVLALAVMAIYANSLSGPFVLDDEASIGQNPQIRDLTQLSEVFRPPPDSPVAGRPIVNLSFAINYAIGGLDVTGYHVWNVAMHLVCALLVYGVVR